MIRTRCPNFSQSRRIATVHELQNPFRCVHRPDETILLGDHPAQFRQKLNQKLVPLFLIQRMIFLSTKGLFTFVVLFNISGSFFYERER
jgi:hypothetical protein